MATDLVKETAKESTSLISWIAGIAGALLVIALSGAVANIFSRMDAQEKRLTTVEINRAADDARFTSLKETLTEIKFKLDELQRAVQAKK